jgi:uncharacterized coiled-coil protein SlyX
MNPWQFAPKEGITAQQIANLFEGLQVRLNYDVYQRVLSIDPTLEEHFRHLTDEEVGSLQKQMRAAIERMKAAAEAAANAPPETEDPVIAPHPSND